MVVIIFCGFVAVLFAFFSQKRKLYTIEDYDAVNTYTYESFSCSCFAISFLFLAVPCFLCGDGTDMPVYVRLYENWTFADLKDLSFEAGYVLLNILLRSFIDNAYIGLGILKVLSLLFVYKALYLLRDRLNFGFSLISYVILLYIFNFHLIRMSLALGMSFLAMSYELKGRSKRTIFLLIAAFFFHYTSVILLLTYCIYKGLGQKITVIKIMFLSLVLILIYGNIVPILQYLVPTIKFFNKYGTYLDNTNSYIGIVQVVLFIPIMYVLANLYRRGIQDKFYILNTVFGIMLFFAGSLGYLLPVISRTVYYFFYCIMTLFSATPLIEDRVVFVIGKIRIKSITLSFFVYLIMQGVLMYIFNDAFASNGLKQYTLWWNM